LGLRALSLYSELASKFPTQIVEPFREPVLIVGVKEFKPQWEEQLKSEGCKILVSDYLGRASFLIRKPNNSESQTENKVQNEPCEDSNFNQKQHGKRKPWTFEETERLKKLFNEGKTYSELVEIFHRNRKCIQQKVYDLGLNKPKVEPLLFKPNPKSASNPTNPNSQALNKIEIRELLEGSLQLLPSYPQAAKILLKEAINQLNIVSG
jgi:hypothetical protein